MGDKENMNIKKIVIILFFIALAFSAILFAYHFIIPDEWETVVMSENYFYDDEDNSKEQSAGMILDNSFDRKRYRKYKIKTNVELVEGECVIRLYDKDMHILKEWDANEETIEEKLDKSVSKNLHMVLAISEKKNCVGVCKITFYGKRKHLVNIRDFFSD